jgi:DNA-binding CsgD family transcriptional regulator
MSTENLCIPADLSDPREERDPGQMPHPDDLSFSPELHNSAPQEQEIDSQSAPECDKVGKSVKNCDISQNLAVLQKLGITDLQVRALRMTLLGMSDTAISAALDISRRTVWNWKAQNPSYRAALAVLRAQCRDALSDRCQNHVVTAANTLANLATECDDLQTRIRAAEILFRHGAKYLHPQDPPPPTQNIDFGQ